MHVWRDVRRLDASAQHRGLDTHTRVRGAAAGCSELPSAEGSLLSRAGKLLPAVQFLQKSIQRHLDDLSKLYVDGAAGRAGRIQGHRVPVLEVLVPSLLVN